MVVEFDHIKRGCCVSQCENAGDTHSVLAVSKEPLDRDSVLVRTVAASVLTSLVVGSRSAVTGGA